VDLCLNTTLKRCGCSEVWLHIFLSLALNGGEWLASCLNWFFVVSDYIRMLGGYERLYAMDKIYSLRLR
jgi:hypothetical protein